VVETPPSIASVAAQMAELQVQLAQLTNAPSKDFLDWMCTHIISDKVLILLGFWDGVDSS
jgi:hypothetical protein